MDSLEKDKRKKSLRFSFLDGIFASSMIGFTQDYFTPFLLVLGGGARETGFLSALPNLVASIAQLKTSDFVKLLKSRKTTITSFVFMQALTLSAITLMAFSGHGSVILFIALVVLFTSFNAIATPAWSSLMSELVPAKSRGAYFGWRSSVLGMIIVATSLCAGLMLNSIDKNYLKFGFIALFGSAFIFRLLSWFFLKRMYDPHMEHQNDAGFTLSGFISKLKNSNYVRFTLFVSLMSFSVYLAAPFFAVLMLKDLHFSYLQYIIIIAPATFTMYFLMGRWGRLADSIGNIRVLRFTSPIIAIIPLMWLVNRHPVFLICAQLISGFAWAGFNLSTSNFIYDSVSPEKRVRYIAYFNFLNGIMLSAGALAGGLLVQVLPPIMGFKILTLFLISTVLRIMVSLTLPFKLKEVRRVSSASSNQIFFSMIGMKPSWAMREKP